MPFGIYLLRDGIPQRCIRTAWRGQQCFHATFRIKNRHTGLLRLKNHVSKIPCGKGHENQFEANKTCLPFLPGKRSKCIFPHCSTSNNHCCYDHFCKSTNNDGNLLLCLCSTDRHIPEMQRKLYVCLHLYLWHELFVINYISCKLLLQKKKQWQKVGALW